MRRGLVLMAGLAVVGTLSACEKAKVPLPPGVHIQLTISAPATTHYEMLCDVRTYEDPSTGQIINRYGVDKTGPFSDVIPSPSAHCTTKIDTGTGPVTVTLSKPGSTQTATIDTVGDDGKKTLHVW